MGVGRAAGKVAAVPKRAVVGFWRGLTYPFKGARFVYVQHPSLIRFWIFPILIVIVLMLLMVGAVWEYDSALVASVIPEPAEGGLWNGVLGVLHGLLEVIVGALLLLAGFVCVTLLSNVLAAPFNDKLSEEVERIVTQRPGPPFSFKLMMRDLVRTVGIEALKLMLWALVMGPLWLLSFAVPVAGQVAYAVFAFVFTAMYWSVDYVDWPASRHNRGISYRFGMVSRHFLPMFGYGTGVWLFLFVPLLNLLFMPAAVAGGTLFYLELESAASGESPAEPAVES